MPHNETMFDRRESLDLCPVHRQPEDEAQKGCCKQCPHCFCNIKLDRVDQHSDFRMFITC